MVRLTTCGNGFEARLLAARLGAEGIVWSLRGGYDGPFAVGSVDVLVDADDLETARELLATDPEVGLDVAEADVAPEPETAGRHVLLLVAVVVGVLLFAAARMLGA